MATDGRLDAAAFGRLMADLAAAWNGGDAQVRTCTPFVIACTL